MTTEKPRRGRPPVAPEDRRDERIEIKATAAELAAWTSAAGDTPLGAWLRELGNRAAKRAR